MTVAPPEPTPAGSPPDGRDDWFDAVIVGAGAAGLTTALGLAGAHGRRVAVVTKTATLVGGSSVYAQGGLAAAVGADDSPGEHAADTLSVAGGIALPDVVAALTADGPAVVERLLALGTPFDRQPDGRLQLGREAAHSHNRILHADGDATGGAIVRTLASAVLERPGVTELTSHMAFELVAADGAVSGVRLHTPDGHVRTLRTAAVVLATGGIGHLYRNTTNPPENTGDGLAMAARAGALLADLEFVQFHPTALAVPGADPLPLLTEALRGEGAVLVDDRGRRFMVDVHPLAELAPRDVVARAIWRELAAGRTVYVDARTAVGARFPTRFPTVFGLCQAHGLDPRVDLVPVAPAAHYHMGGLVVDGCGRSTLRGLWACGEVTSTGVHGANRLASNSLLEAIAFGGHVADDIGGGGPGAWPTLVTVGEPVAIGDRASGGEWARHAVPLPSANRHRSADAQAGGAVAGAPARGEVAPLDVAAVITAIRQTAWDHVGLMRDAAGLAAAAATFARLSNRLHGLNDASDAVGVALRATASGHATASIPQIEAQNLALVGRLVAAAALARDESRGAHYRIDHPQPDDARWARRQFVALDGDRIAVDVASSAGPLSARAQ